ncbi:hypothetical protein GCM10018962_47090 [Dactylosporangium matsuzakiense]|uniref:DUF6311 domain-containing protein n=1 Tax=Dactylosporangium matsuzakiense TaxID=53360 RepID=A0A9W6NPP9_9ACTN|nr:hypothetical protein GCM10017581_061980 [Dactylosporangium matsuzakiense]
MIVPRQPLRRTSDGNYGVTVKFGEKTREVRAAAAALLSYVVCSVLVLQHLWADPQGRMFADNAQDQIFFEWVLTHAARLFTHGDNPFFTDQLNAPDGVNLMANTSVLGLALPFAPITLLFGAGVTLVLMDTIALAGTAIAWYFILSRHVVRSRAAAYIGGLFCGFAPSMISQSTAHPNIAGQFLIPFIVWNILRLREPGSAVRRGLVLGAVVLYQCFINEEVLFLTAVALLIFLLAYLHPREYLPSVRAALPAILIGAAAAGVLLAYPLYHQFFGPQAYRGLPDFVHGFSTDLASFKEFSRRSIMAPDDLSVIDKMGGPTEENTFFGWPLLGLLLAGTVALWRQRAARALFITALVFSLLSLGTVIKYKGEETGWHGPWNWVHELPLFDSVVPTRMGVAIAPLLGVILAMVVDRFIVGLPATSAQPVAAGSDAGDAADGALGGDAGGVGGGSGGDGGGTLVADESALPETSEGAVGVKTDVRPQAEETTPVARWLWAAALAIALVPLIPTPQPASPRAPIPAFFSTNAWRAEIPENSTVVAIPLGWFEGLDAMRWSTAAGLDFKIAGGYFLVPNPDDPEKVAIFNAPTRPTMQLMNSAATDGTVPVITPDQKAMAKLDLAFWKADYLVLPDQHGNSEAVRQTADQLFGPGKHVVDVWVYKVTS